MNYYTATAWRRLILRYADGRQPCNCGDAYYDTNRRCPGGCSANQLAAKEELAQRIEQELPIQEITHRS